MNTSFPHGCHCRCCKVVHSSHPPLPPLNRREFLFRVGAVAATGLAAGGFESFAGDPALALPTRGPLPLKALKVQPVLTYQVPQRREHTSWRSWGGIQTEEDATAEKNRIATELARLKSGADFPLEMLPTVGVQTAQQAANISKAGYDVLLVYGAGGDGRLLETLISPEKWNLMFLRHDPGPVYLWYEIVHPRFLRKTVDEYSITGLDVHDVVVDKHEDILWRLRALHGLKHTLGKRIVAIGGAGGWGAGGQKAPQIARSLWKLDLVDYPYKELEPRLKSAHADIKLVKRCEAAAKAYLGESRLSLHTRREFVDNAFVLREVMRDIMDEAHTDAITVQHCMGTIMGISQTTACLPLSMLNDAGYLAFCESDFVVIPSGILLHYISGKPVFLNDPTFPHDKVVTLAHCTAPRKMDGRRAERTKILTHFESDYGAAPKVEMRKGQLVTNLIAGFEGTRWAGLYGEIVDAPFLPICRSQIDVRFKADPIQVAKRMGGFHWITGYGDSMREVAYALRRLNIEFDKIG